MTMQENIEKNIFKTGFGPFSFALRFNLICKIS